MLKLSYRVIFTGLLSMITAAGLLFIDTLPYVAYVLLGAGFLMVGVGLLLGFFKMVTDDRQ